MAAVEKLVEVVETEVAIEFKPGVKCRSDLHLRSLHPTCAVAFKVQTSAPHKFHVNPPNGVLPPLSSAVLQVILRPQPLPPPSFPRSPSDRFLIKASLSSSFADADAAAATTHDTRLKVAYVGPFLLHHAATLGDAAAVRHLLRRQPSLLSGLPPADSTALFRSADPSLLSLPPRRGWTGRSAARRSGEGLDGGGSRSRATCGNQNRDIATSSAASPPSYLASPPPTPPLSSTPPTPPFSPSLRNGVGRADPERGGAARAWTAGDPVSRRRKRGPRTPSSKTARREASEAVARRETAAVAWSRIREWAEGSRRRTREGRSPSAATSGASLVGSEARNRRRESRAEVGMDARDGDGRTALQVAAGRGQLRCARVLVERGADKDARSRDGRPAVYCAAANGDADVVMETLKNARLAY